MNTDTFKQLDSYLELDVDQELNPPLDYFSTWNVTAQEALLSVKESEITEQNKDLDELLSQYETLTDVNGDLDEAVEDTIKYIQYLRTEYAKYLNQYLVSTSS